MLTHTCKTSLSRHTDPKATFLESGACDGGYVDKVFTAALHTNFNEEARGLVFDDDYEPYSGVQKTCRLKSRIGDGTSTEEALVEAEAWHLWGWRGVPIKCVGFKEIGYFSHQCVSTIM